MSTNQVPYLKFIATLFVRVALGFPSNQLSTRVKGGTAALKSYFSSDRPLPHGALVWGIGCWAVIPNTPKTFEIALCYCGWIKSTTW